MLQSPSFHTHDEILSLLDGMTVYDAEYGGELSNHLPMALVALWRIGGDRSALAEFRKAYAGRLTAPRHLQGPSAAKITQQSLKDHFGRIESFPGMERLFRRQLDTQGIAELLRWAIPLLAPGCGAAAFHGLIRTAYGVEIGHSGEIARGLAYWSARYLPLLSVLPADGGLEASEWLARLAENCTTEKPAGSLIAQRMLAIGKTKSFQRSAPELRINEDTLRDLVQSAATLYIETRNFTVLHFITSCHAMNGLKPHVDDWASFIHWYALAAGAAIASSAVERSRAPLDETLTWAEIRQRAIASNEDHVLKLVHSCEVLERAFGGSKFRTAASRGLPEIRHARST